MRKQTFPSEKKEGSLKKRPAAFTLFEILVACLIIAIIVALALPNLTGSKERALGKEVRAQLKLIAAAEKSYRWDSSSFYPYDGSTVTDIDSINRNLALSLTNKSWNFSIQGSSTAFNATASRKTSTCQYWLAYNVSSTSNPEEPSSSAACPR